MRKLIPLFVLALFASIARAADPAPTTPATPTTFPAAFAPLAPLAIAPDITVAADGSGKFTTIQAALDSVPKDNRERIVILVKNGVYKERIHVDPSFITIRGESRAGTRIEYPIPYSDWQRFRDAIGRAVVNVGPSIAPTTAPTTKPDLTGSDFILQNITVKNTAGITGHAFAFYTETADRIVITDADVLSDGNDTLAPMNSNYHGGGHYYFARLNVRGGVDFVCPKGWCYLADSSLSEVKIDAAAWHNGSGGKDQKFVLRNVRFNGEAERFVIGRHHVAANFYFLDCTFAKNMTDRAPFLVRYAAGSAQNDINDKMNLWGERKYYYNCHREPGAGEEFAWYKNNLETAEGSPKPEQITAAWTFDNKWDPESTIGPKIKAVAATPDGKTAVTFTESVTVKQKLSLTFHLASNPGLLYTVAYVSGSGSDTLTFDIPQRPPGLDLQPPSLDRLSKIQLHNGLIVATQACAALRPVDLTPPKSN